MFLFLLFVCFGVQGSGFRVQGSGFKIQGSGFRIQGSGFSVQGSEFRVQGSPASPRNVNIRLPGKGNSNSHGVRPVY